MLKQSSATPGIDHAMNSWLRRRRDDRGFKVSNREKQKCQRDRFDGQRLPCTAPFFRTAFAAGNHLHGIALASARLFEPTSRSNQVDERLMATVFVPTLES